MKVNFAGCISYPVLLLFLGLLFILSTATQNMYAQSVIYKSDGTTVTAYKLSKEGAVRSYWLSNDSTGMIYSIGKDAIDSIRYEDGSLERFSSGIMLPETINPTQKPKKNFLGVNIWPFFYKDLEIFYERLIGEHLGFKNNILIRLMETYPYNYYESLIYSINSGVNYYFLESDLFRFGTGAAVNIGQFEQENYSVEPYYEYDPYSDNYYPIYNYSTEKKMHGTVFINGSFTIKIQDIFFTTVELDIPLFNYHPYAVLFKTELAITF